MAIDRFYIGYTEGETGLNTYFKPYAIPDTAYSQLLNAYVFRGRVRKRFGSRYISNDPTYGALQSRFRVQVGVTSTIGGVPGCLAGSVKTLTNSTIAGAAGQAFSIDTVFFTVYNPAGGPQQMYRTDGNLDSATYRLSNTTFNIVNVAVPDGTAVYFYPALPVMGLPNYETFAVNAEFTVGFDTNFAYQYLAGWQRLAAETNPGDAVWTGANDNFFWASTWSGSDPSDRVLYVTNNYELEPNYMRYLSSIVGILTWTTFRPPIGAGFYVNMAAIIVPFHGRLLLFNTWEGVDIATQKNYSHRCRYSQFEADPTDASSFLTTAGRGGAIDASTVEAIVTVEFIKDRLIVFFERSTWELVYTGNQAYPFTWQQINTELGAESTFSIVPFDKVCIGVGNVGIHACNGSNVERIDSSIPDTVFDIHNDNGGIYRVYGIRDYEVETVYWTFPNTDSDVNYPYPNRVLIYNYKTGAWAFNDDSITAFGYFQPNTGITWSSNTILWNSNITWNSGAIQSQFRQVIAGNQEGYTFVCDPDIPTNELALQITNITISAGGDAQLTIIDHNLRQGEYVFLDSIVWDDASVILNGLIFQVSSNIDSNNITIDNASGPNPVVITGNYLGGGLVSRVSKIDIQTKEYNFYSKQARNAYIPKVEFLVDSTAKGQIQAYFYASSSTDNLTVAGASTGALVGTGILETFPYTVLNVPAPVPFEQNAVRLWHPVYFQAEGEFVQIQLTFNDTQMRNVDIRGSEFDLHAVCFFSIPTSYRFQ